MLKTILANVKEFKKDSILTPIFMILEVIFACTHIALRFCNMVTSTNSEIFCAIYDVNYPPQKLKIFKISC